MTDYLKSAKTVLDYDAPSPHDLGLADTHSLISIAESLAVLADLVGGLRHEAQESAEIIGSVAAILGSGSTASEQLSAIRAAVTGESERQLVEVVARAIQATYMAVNPEVSTWVDLPNECEEYRNEARAALAAIREAHVIEPKLIAGTEAASAYFDAYFPDVHSLLDAITATHTKPEVEA